MLKARIKIRSLESLENGDGRVDKDYKFCKKDPLSEFNYYVRKDLAEAVKEAPDIIDGWIEKAIEGRLKNGQR